MTGGGPKMVQFVAKMAKHSRLVNVPNWSKRIHKQIWGDICVWIREVQNATRFGLKMICSRFDTTEALHFYESDKTNLNWLLT